MASVRDETSPHGVLANIFSLLLQRFLGANDVVKVFALPYMANPRELVID